MTRQLPPDHPPLKPRKIGVLLANLGTPDSPGYWDMRRYLSEFLSDKRVIDYPAWKWQPILQGIILSKRPFTSGRAYASIWEKDSGHSPLMRITMEQSDALAVRLAQDRGDGLLVDFCMRYGNPSTASKVRAMVEAGCDRILFVPLYPQYAGPTTATANDEFFRALMKEKWQPAARTAPAYFDRPSYIEALANSVTEGLAGAEPDLLLCSYHGMPQRYLEEGDPYHCQCQKTTRLLRERLGWAEEKVATSFQSQFGPEEWLKPYTVEEVAARARAGVKHIAVVSPAFSADCIETLEEIEMEIRHAFLEAGGETFTYIPCLNARPDHIEALAELVEENLAGWV